MTTRTNTAAERGGSTHWPKDLLQRLADRDPDVWERVVSAYRPCIYARAAHLRLKPWQRHDLEQRVWLALLENAMRIRDAACLPGWLSTTARRAGLQLLQQEGREIPTDHFAASSAGTGSNDVEQQLLDAERLSQLRNAVARLNPRQRQVVQALLRDLSYDQLAAQLGIPMGSVGPTRQRALTNLRIALSAA
ncbi:MAG: sigma-70 family RNA polymerase sigma factor [Micropruina sp.]|nr:sigma-70 family RNA polymerase sigma factor [Micropruina sp.]